MTNLPCATCPWRKSSLAGGGIQEACEDVPLWASFAEMLTAYEEAAT